jgi:hypothetical protein
LFAAVIAWVDVEGSLMKRRKIFKPAVCGSLAVVLLGTHLVVIEADNPHVEQRQHEEAPRMTYEPAYTTTTGAVYGFPILDPTLESIPVSINKK